MIDRFDAAAVTVSERIGDPHSGQKRRYTGLPLSPRPNWADPDDLAPVLALNRDHRVGQLADDLTLLFLAEHILDNLRWTPKMRQLAKVEPCP